MMKRWMKQLLVAVLSLAMVFCVVACQSAPAQAPAADQAAPAADAAVEKVEEAVGTDDPIKVGYCISDNTTDTFAILVKENFENIVKENHPDWQVVAQEAKWDVNNELAITESFIQDGCDVIVYHAVDTNGSVASVETCNAAGVPVVTIINPVAGGDKVYVGGSNYECGEIMADQIRDMIPQNGTVCIMLGAAGATNSEDRANGFKDNLKRDDVVILDEQCADWTVEKGMSVMENWIQAYEKIDLVVCVSDTMTPGAVEALKGADRLDETMVISVDGTKEGLEMVKNGDVVFDMLYNATGNAQNAVTVCERILAGEPVEDMFYSFEPIWADQVDELVSWYFLGT